MMARQTTEAPVPYSEVKAEQRVSGKKARRLLSVLVACVVLVVASCTKDGDIIYQPDPADQVSTAPTVVVIFDPNALGDKGYNDLIYQGVEDAARRHGLRTMQLSPETADEGMAYLQELFQQMTVPDDTVRRLFIIAAASYDNYLRANNNRLSANPYADLLYLETDTPLEGKGHTLYMPYYGAMYEAGAIAPVEATDVLLVGANAKLKPVAEAVQGFTDGFQASTIRGGEAEKTLVTVWLADEATGGFSVADSTALRLMCGRKWQGERQLLVPVCGGAGTTFRRFCELLGEYDYMGVDCTAVSSQCQFSAVKHIDRAVARCIEQWLSPEGMPKHQTLGLADGYTGVELHPWTADSKSRFSQLLGDDRRQAIHEEAVRKEALLRPSH